MATVRGIEVERGGRVVRLLEDQRVLSSDHSGWNGFVLEEHHTPALDVPAHQHTAHSVCIYTTESVPIVVFSGGRRRREVVGPGMVTVMPRGLHHRSEIRAPLRQIVVTLHPQFVARTIDEIAPPDLELSEVWTSDDRHIAMLIEALRIDLDEGLPAGRLYGESLGTSLAVYLARRYGTELRSRRGPRGGLSEYKLRRVLEYIAGGLDRDLGLAELAAVVGMSTHYFAELFRQRMHKTPHRYVLERRIERAKSLLKDPRRRVIEIAQLTGFRDQSHFSRVFQRIAGVTPTVYRRNI